MVNGYQTASNGMLNGLDEKSELITAYNARNQPTVLKANSRTSSNEPAYLIQATASSSTQVLYDGYDSRGRFLGQYQYKSNKLQAYGQTPAVWTTQQDGGYKNKLTTLQSAEADKLRRWLNALPNLGPTQAATREGIELTKLNSSPKYGTVYHLYVGKSARIFFTCDDQRKIVYLQDIGHTL